VSFRTLELAPGAEVLVPTVLHPDAGTRCIDLAVDPVPRGCRQWLTNGYVM